MSAIATIQPMPAATQPAPVAAPDPYRPTNMDQAMKIAEIVARSDLAPKDYRGKPGNVFVAMQMGHELGLSPMQSVQNIAIINGRPSVWGDALLALCQARPDFEDIIETDDGTTATCQVRRRGRTAVIRTFSMDDAKRAGLLGKQGPWTNYPARMRQMRARGFALRDCYADALRGIGSAEENEDSANTEPMRAEVVTASPQASEPARSAVESVKAKLAARRATKKPSLEDVLELIADAGTVADLERVVVPKAKLLEGDDQGIARDAYAKRKADIENGEALYDGSGDQFHVDPETGEVRDGEPASEQQLEAFEAQLDAEVKGKRGEKRLPAGTSEYRRGPR